MLERIAPRTCGSRGSAVWRTAAALVVVLTCSAGLLAAQLAGGAPVPTQGSPGVPSPNVTGTMAASGTFSVGGSVVYTVTLTNDGGATQPDNPGFEFFDTLPVGVTLEYATASFGTIHISGNNLGWNGSIPPSMSRVIPTTITAGVTVIPPRCRGASQREISLDEIVSTQGTISFDADANGTNETNGVTDDPNTANPNDPTAFTVPAVPGTPVKFSYTGPPVPIPDTLTDISPGAPVVVSLPVAAVASGIFDIDFRIDGTSCSATAGATTVGIDHTFVNDLELTLRSPAGTAVLVVDNTDGSGNNFCQTVLDDESAGPSIQSVVTAQAPFTGSFTPNAPLSAFDGEDPNGLWELQVQDFASGDTGNIRDISMVITPQLCELLLPANVTGTKSASGSFVPGGNVTYTIVLSNSGPGIQNDNPGNEFTDILPAGLTLVSASATSGAAGTAANTVTWNGSIPAAGSVTMSINATVNNGTAGQTFSNQGFCSYDSDANDTNDASCITDDPATAAVGDPTSVTVIGVSQAEIPALSEIGLAILCLALAGAALLCLRWKG